MSTDATESARAALAESDAAEINRINKLLEEAFSCEPRIFVLAAGRFCSRVIPSGHLQRAMKAAYSLGEVYSWIEYAANLPRKSAE